MDLSTYGSWASIVGLFIGLSALIFGGKKLLQFIFRKRETHNKLSNNTGNATQISGDVKDAKFNQTTIKKR